MHRRLDANLLLGVVILADNSLRAMGEAIHRKMDEEHLLIVDEVVALPPTITKEMIKEMVMNRYSVEEPVVHQIKPNQYAGDSWRRQGKRRGSPRR